MKRNIVRTVFFGTLLLSLAAAALAQDTNCPCSNRDMAGVWAVTKTGTVLTPTGSVPYADVVRAIHDGSGNISATVTSNLGGTVSHGTVRGTYTVNPDCTGTKNLRTYDQSGNLIMTATIEFVLTNNANEYLELATSAYLPNGTPVPGVTTGHAAKIFPNNDRRQCYWFMP